MAGQDATEAFEDVGHSDEARETLDNLLVGTLKRQVRLEADAPYRYILDGLKQLPEPPNKDHAHCSFCTITIKGQANAQSPLHSPATQPPRLPSPAPSPPPHRPATPPAWASVSTLSCSSAARPPTLPTNISRPSRLLSSRLRWASRIGLKVQNCSAAEKRRAKDDLTPSNLVRFGR